MRNTTPTRTHNRKLAYALYGSLPLLALALPAAAQAQSASNTASLTLPTGVTDPNPGNNTATDTDDVLAALAAVNDSATGISAAAGAADVLNVFTGDTVNGNPANTGNADLYLVSGSTPTGITFDTSTGDVSVAAGTAPGTYTFDYNLCAEGSTTNCDTATVTLIVDAAINPVTETGTGTAGIKSTVIDNVRENDMVNGEDADATNSTISQSGTWPAGITLDTATGAVSITDSVAPGTYNIAYQLCDDLTPQNCATVTDTVTVAANIAPVTESGTGTAGTASTVINNVRANDTVNGVQATPGNSSISQSGTWPTGITLDTATGAVDITGSVPPGTYAITYELCDDGTPANCATVQDTVTVAASVKPVTEDGTGKTGTTSIVIDDVRENDEVNGQDADEDNSTISQSGTWPTGITLDTDTGAITVDASVAPGTYPVTYQLCDKSSPTPVCATVEDEITVTNRQADVSLTKSNGVDEVTSGQTISYTLTISNSGPDSVTGVVVSDSPGAGLTCPAGNALTFGGAAGAIPAGPFTISNLTGSGVTLGTLEDGESVTVTYSCTVN